MAPLNTYSETGITEELQEVIQLAMNDESDLKRMLVVAAKLLRKASKQETDALEATEAALAIVTAVQDWMEGNERTGQSINSARETARIETSKLALVSKLSRLITSTRKTDPREALIAHACRVHKAAEGTTCLLGQARREFVDGQLLANGHRRLQDDEANRLGIRD